MTLKLKSFLKKVCKPLSKKNRIKTYKELRAHFEQQLQNFLEQGYNKQQATDKILQSQPNPYFLGYKMRRAQMSFVRRHLFELSLAGVFAFCILTFQYIDSVLQNQILPELRQVVKVDQQNEIYFENDLKYLIKHSNLNFPHTSRQKNAATFIYSDMKLLLENSFLPEFQKLQKLHTYVKNVDFVDDVKLVEQILSVDTSWLDQLAQFDYLDHFSAQDYQRFENADLSMIEKIGLNAGSNGDMFLTTLTAYSFHHSLQLCLKQRCLDGLASLRKVASLLNSTHRLIGQTTAVNLLRKEKFLVEKFNVKNYNTIDAEVLNAYERVSWGWKNIVAQSFIKQNMAERWQQYAKPELGLCAAVSEMPFGFFTATSDFLEKKWAFESDYSELMKNEKPLLFSLHKKCDLQFYTELVQNQKVDRKIITDNKVTAWLWDQYGLTQLDWINLAAIPNVKNYVGLKLFSATYIGQTWGIYKRIPPKI